MKHECSHEVVKAACLWCSRYGISMQNLLTFIFSKTKPSPLYTLIQSTTIREDLGARAGTHFPVLFNTPTHETKPMALLQMLLCDRQLRERTQT